MAAAQHQRGTNLARKETMKMWSCCWVKNHGELEVQVRRDEQKEMEIW